jgi:anti-sigma B factor antagonist
MNVRFEERDAVGVVSPQEAMTAETADSFREQFIAWFEATGGVKNVVVTLERVDFMDSSGLGTLIALLKRVSEREGDMKIACLSKKVRMVFEITRAYKVFEIVDSVDEAIRACQ